VIVFGPRTATAQTAAPPQTLTARAPYWVGAGASLVGGTAIAVGLTHDATRLWSDLLINGFFVLAGALGGLVFIAIHHLSGAAWSSGFRRVAEALTSALPIATVMMLALYFGRGFLYPWAGAAHAQHAGVHSSAYFAVPFVFARMAVFLLVWMALAAAIRRSSARQDESVEPIHQRRMVRYSAIFAVVFAWSFSLAAIDWVLSLDPHWTSTIFAVYALAGVLVEGVAAITLAAVLLHDRGYLHDVVNENHLHDLGKLLLAFTTFWAYIWLSQYLLIWYGNLPDEASYYQTRTDSAWLAWFLGNLAINWVIPFVVLLPRASKRSPTILKRVAIVVLLGRWLDVYLLVAPQTAKAPALGLLEAAIAIAYVGIAWHVVSAALARRPLVVRFDPYLDDCIRHHQ
jgi:hypothetical protein